ncbi:MAG TPA: hypothetical protein DCG48_13520 [Rhodospirillaceae bacterium]|nr:hypothetical protein [Rhodospirillaceae bacterium]
MKKIIAAAFVAAVFAGSAAPAFAFHCPRDMKAIDAALAKQPKLSADQLAQVAKLRAEGEALHKSGDHKGSVDTLKKAMEILGLN